MKNLKIEYDYTPNLTPVSSSTSVASLNDESLIPKNTLDESIYEVYEEKLFIKYNRSNSFHTLRTRKIIVGPNFINNKSFVMRSDTCPF